MEFFMINFTKRQRSELWFKINDDNSIVTSSKWKDVLSYNLELDDNFWFRTHNNNDDNYLLSFNYIANRSDEIQLFLDYINQFIWLGLNKHIKDYFNDNILDYCIARDLNFFINCDINVLIGQSQYFLIYNKKTLENNLLYLQKIKTLTDYELVKYNYKGKNNLLRTSLGYTEFMLKYRRCDIDNNIDFFYNILVNGIIDCLEILPLDTKNIYFTTIPINKNENDKLSYNLVQKISSILNNYNVFIVKCYKPSFKDKTLNEKISIWNEIYSDISKFNFIGKVDITDKDVIIIDDLYQSGISMWSYAKFIKSLGAKRVMGISAIKSLRDSDNTNV